LLNAQIRIKKKSVYLFSVRIVEKILRSRLNVEKIGKKGQPGGKIHTLSTAIAGQVDIFKNYGK